MGSTTYKVRIHFSETAEDTLQDKILHLVQNEAAAKFAVCGTMGVPQTGQPLEGSSL
ncbi:transposon-encoded TnpW family protein [Oscillospiraceae bacterium 38-13]